MAAPTEWLSEFQVNTGTANTPSTSDPHILGLSNGNILVAWTETGTTGVGTTAGLDIIGKIYDGAGNVVRDSYRINTSYTAHDEADFDIGATNDGGFILVFIDNDGDDSRLVWQRKNAAGNNTHTQSVVSETSTGDYDNPQVAVSNASNSSYITFTSYDPSSPADDDIRGIRISDTGTTLTAEFEAAQDGGFPSDSDNQIQNAVALNHDGAEFVSAYRDSTDNTVRVDVYSTTGALQHTAVVDDNGTPHEPDVATLTNGNIVVVWEDDGDDINYRVYNQNLGVVVGKTAIDTSDANEVQVVALPNGEFVIIYDDDDGTPSIRGRKYNADGTSDGGIFEIENANGTSPEISVTGDGRVLFTWSQAGNIWMSIWDPRDGNIITNTYDSPYRQFVDGDIIYGKIGGGTILGDSGSPETIIGQDGNDFISASSDNDSLEGNGGNDTLYGGQGNDTILGGAGNDIIDGDQGNDSIDAGANNDLIRMYDDSGLDLIDGGTGDDTVDFTNELSTVQANLLNDFYTIGASIARDLDNVEHVNGGDGDDILTGDNTANKINGDDGDDILIGRNGNDTLDGEGGTDRADYSYSVPPAGPALISSWTFNMGAGTAVFGNQFNPTVETDTLINIENIRGSGWGDTFVDAGGGGAANANHYEGLNGNDTFTHAGLGLDTLDGGNNTDTLISELSWLDAVLFDLDAGRASFGGTDYDTLINIENVTVAGAADVTGDAQNNRLEAVDFGVDHSNTFLGGGGDDTLIGGIGDDSLDGGTGNDLFIDDLADGLTTIAGGSGLEDALDLSSSATGFLYDGSDDVFVGADQRLTTSSLEILTGSDFDDNIFEGSLDTILAGDGNDTVRGFVSSGQDVFDGGDGIDNFVSILSNSLSYNMDTGVLSNGGGLLNFENITLLGGNDTVIGNDADNRILMGGGDDSAQGGLGNDEILGGAGSDTLEGGAGNDTLRGGAGVDRLVGGADDDDYYVDNSNDDVIEGAAGGFDRVFSSVNFALRDSSQETENLILTGTGNTNGTGNVLANVITGNSGDNILDGAVGADTIIAGSGNDTAIGGFGADRVLLNAGDDVFNDSTQTGVNGQDTVFGGIGNDTLNGAGGNDELHGEGDNDEIYGGGGNDAIFGGAGFDTIRAGDGLDTVYGGDGRDDVLLGAGDDIFFDTSQGGVNGQDTVFGGNGNDTIQGGNGNDVFHGEGDNDEIYGRLGDDQLFGGSGYDTLNSGDGNDTVYGGDGRDEVFLGADNDIFFDTSQGGINGQDTVFAGTGDDTVQGGNGNDVFHGEAGNDVIHGRLGDDSIFGGDNYDTIYAGENNDLVFGGNGRDRIFLGTGDDRYVDTNQGGVNGQDTITGAAGADEFVFGATTGADVITDFVKGVDELELDDALWGGGKTAAQVVSDHATDVGADVLFDFGSGNTILLQGVNNLSGLASDLDIV